MSWTTPTRSKTPRTLLFRRVLALGCTLLTLAAPVLAAAVNPNAIIDQSETFYNGITADQINSFLATSGSALANYVIPDSFDVYYPSSQGQWATVSVPQQWTPANGAPPEVYSGKTVAQLIYEWSTSVTQPGRNPSNLPAINPLIALATLEKESVSITGPYHADITTNHPVTLSWLAGYGYDEGMASCYSSGNCDLNHNLQMAQYYGGPGQQIAEMIWFMRKQITNPTTYGSGFCDPNDWRTIKIDGQCLSLQNSISYALYRYTPHPQQRFFDTYTAFKAQFASTARANPTPSPSVDEKTSDTAAYTEESYTSKVSLVGQKSPAVQAWFRNKLIADFSTTSWNLSYEPKVGNVEDAIEYRRADGSVVNRKSIKINRHTSGDVNGDGKVDILDLSMVAVNWGKTDPENTLVNLNPGVDNGVDLLDLSIISANWSQ